MSFMNLLGFLLMIPFAIDEKTFPPALALTANQFTVPFNYISLAVTGNADHFNLLEDSAYGVIERVPLVETDSRNFNAAASYDLRLLRLYMEKRTRKIMTTMKMKEPNRSEFFKTSFMIGFRMPFNSKYQPLHHVTSYTLLLQGWNTDHFPEVFVAIIHDTENCCPRGAYL
jgi:hypothetical protein